MPMARDHFKLKLAGPTDKVNATHARNGSTRVKASCTRYQRVTFQACPIVMLLVLDRLFYYGYLKSVAWQGG